MVEASEDNLKLKGTVMIVFETLENTLLVLPPESVQHIKQVGEKVTLMYTEYRFPTRSGITEAGPVREEIIKIDEPLRDWVSKQAWGE